MRFTFWSVGLPSLIVLAVIIVGGVHDPTRLLGSFNGPLAIWIIVGFPLTVIYWIVRLVRHAWDQGRASAPADPEINSTGPDTGRIFGNLN